MSIILRNIKGSELTFTEVDGNFSSLFYSSSLEGNILKLHYFPNTSQSIDLSTLSPDAFSGSLLITASAADNTVTFTKGDGSTFPVIVQTGSIADTLTAASIASNVITFTKGDGDQFTLTVDTGSAGIFSQTGSFQATTNDLQITGSLIISGSSVRIISDNSYNAIHITGGLDISRDLAVKDDLTVYDDANLRKDTNIRYEDASYPLGYSLAVTQSNNISGSAIFEGRVSASSFSGVGSEITGVISSSYALSSSFAETASYVESAQTASHILADNVIQPFTNLTASSNISSSGIIFSSASIIEGDIAKLTFKKAGFVAGAVKTSGSSLIFDGTSGIERARFLSTGQFGIGTTTPSEKLTVGGNISSSGYISASSFNAAPNTINELTASYAITSSHALNTSTYDYLAIGTIPSGTVNSPPMGTGYSSALGVATTGGSGTGMTVDTVVVGGGVQTVTINNPGTGYVIGDNNIVISGGNGAAIITLSGNISETNPSLRLIDNAFAFDDVKLTGGTNVTITRTSETGITFDAAATTSPGGLTTQIQFNDAGSFNGDPRLIFKKSTGLIQLSGSLEITGSSNANSFLIKSASLETFKINDKGVAVFGDLPYTPSAIEGGLIFSGSSFWVGL